MATQKLKDYLTRNKIPYLSISHPVAYATREISHLSNISERSLAKSVIIRVGEKPVMLVLPSNEVVNFEVLKKILRENEVTLMPEEAFSNLFPDCELGAMPPFGNLYDLDVYVEKDLTKNNEIAFNAGNHNEIIKMKYQDFEKLVNPKIVTMH